MSLKFGSSEFPNFWTSRSYKGSPRREDWYADYLQRRNWGWVREKPSPNSRNCYALTARLLNSPDVVGLQKLLEVVVLLLGRDFCELCVNGVVVGTSVNSRPQVSPFVNRMIKSILSQAALAAIKFDMNVHNYYQRLIERGKHPLLVHNNIKNKMLHILVAMVRDRVKYNPDNVYGTSNEVSLAPQVLNI